YRVTADPRVWRFSLDEDVSYLRALCKSVRRDVHKMKAFVRFREVRAAHGAHFIAWFEPEHHILERTAPFFVRRFSNMAWTILTPARKVNWDGAKLSFGPGGRREDVPADDASETLWLAYYENIFNPARLKTRAMEKEMPRKYWRNLPEAALIAPLVARAQIRAENMVAANPVEGAHDWTAPARPVPSPVIRIRSLGDLRAAVHQCRDCPLWQTATQAVHGDGYLSARVMLVGEQPGDQEDLTGKAFVGPAGQLLDKALMQAGIRRDELFVTNAVRHFKFELRGRRRLHKTPAQKEIEACNHWLQAEIKLLRPKLIVALGATAARAVLQRGVHVENERGRLIDLGNAHLLVTMHPAALLRMEALQQGIALQRFVGDLSLMKDFVAATLA
ncbi:MAG TPA: UdgX family uracil-DNA binding protein, partial [Burkholderiales bacterium]|nr:UdgX family uracil-DNA binding protein [Burkholderiales bacterium]